MAAKIYRAVIEHPKTPGKLQVIAVGGKARCEGALDAWSAMNPGGELLDDCRPLLLVEVDRADNTERPAIHKD